MVAKVEKLDNYLPLIQGFDHIRAGKYVEAGRLTAAIEHTQTIDLVEKHLPDWKEFSSEYRAFLSKTRAITRSADFLKVFELSILATYVSLLGINLFAQVSWIPVVLPWATVFVFAYFGFTYGITFFTVDKPTEKFLQNYHKKNKKFAKGLYKLVCSCVDNLDRALLETGLSAAEYGLQLYAKDYPGIFVTTKPGRVVGDRFYRAVPYPLHIVFAENRSRINVLMYNYRDDRLLKALADMASKFQLNMVVTSNMTSHIIFRRAVDDILQRNTRSSVRVVPSKSGTRAVVVFTVDGFWQLDFGRSLKPNELKYAPVDNEDKRKELEFIFNQGVEHGEKYTP